MELWARVGLQRFTRSDCMPWHEGGGNQTVPHLMKYMCSIRIDLSMKWTQKNYELFIIVSVDIYNITKKTKNAFYKKV